MLTGKELGAAIEAARIAKGVNKKQLAETFGVKPPSVQGWVNTGRIDKSKLMELIAYFSDTVGPEHWGLSVGWFDHVHGESPAESARPAQAAESSEDDTPESQSSKSGGIRFSMVESEQSGARMARLTDLPADAELARIILQNIHALIEYKCPDRELGGLAQLTGIPFEELYPIVTLERPIAELIDLAERIEIALKMPEGAMTNSDPASWERRYLIRFLLDELPSLDPFIKYEARLLAALIAIKKASDEGRTTFATVHALEEIAEKLPTTKRNPPQDWFIPRKQTSKDKDKDPPRHFWF